MLCCLDIPPSPADAEFDRKACGVWLGEGVDALMASSCGLVVGSAVCLLPLGCELFLELPLEGRLALLKQLNTPCSK